MPASAHSERYFEAVSDLARTVEGSQVDAIAQGLAAVRERGGRLFILGVGGGAGHASHAVNDFRKLCLIESYAPTDNVSELTARTNDDGWDTSFVEWLGVSKLSERDALLVFSVGGGSREHNVSVNLVNAIERAREVGAAIYGVVGAPGGTLAELADVAVIIDAPGDLKTPLVESFQAVVWHALVSHPQLAARQGHWESLAAGAATLRRAAFIDRDGTIDELVPDPVSGEPEGPLHARDVALIPGAAAALRDLVRRRVAADRRLQPARRREGEGVAGGARRGPRAGARAARVPKAVRFDDFRLCMHHPDGVVPELTLDCDCRKPAPGMLLEAAGSAGRGPRGVVDDRRYRRRRRGRKGRGLQDGPDRARPKRSQAQRNTAPDVTAPDLAAASGCFWPRSE